MSITQNKKRAKTDYDMTYEAGRKAEYDAFWDAVQDNGKRANYKNGFSGRSWNAKTFYPKYDIRPTTSTSAMFQETYVYIERGYHPFSLTERLKECGVVLDFSQIPPSYSSASTIFYASAFTEITDIDLTWATSLEQTFRNSSYLETVSFKLNTEGTTRFNLPFGGCSKLVNLTIEGTIGQNDFDVKDSPNLSKASIYSVIYALATNPDPAVNNPAVTLSKAAVDKAFEMPSGANNGSTSLEWAVLSEERGAWTKALV